MLIVEARKRRYFQIEFDPHQKRPQSKYAEFCISIQNCSRLHSKEQKHEDKHKLLLTYSQRQRKTETKTNKSSCSLAHWRQRQTQAKTKTNKYHPLHLQKHIKDKHRQTKVFLTYSQQTTKTKAKAMTNTSPFTQIERPTRTNIGKHSCTSQIQKLQDVSKKVANKIMGPKSITKIRSCEA